MVFLCHYSLDIKLLLRSLSLTLNDVLNLFSVLGFSRLSTSLDSFLFNTLILYLRIFVQDERGFYATGLKRESQGKTGEELIIAAVDHLWSKIVRLMLGVGSVCRAPAVAERQRNKLNRFKHIKNNCLITSSLLQQCLLAPNNSMVISPLVKWLLSNRIRWIFTGITICVLLIKVASQDTLI